MTAMYARPKYVKKELKLNEDIPKKLPTLQKNPPNVNARIGAITVNLINCGKAIASAMKMIINKIDII